MNESTGLMLIEDEQLLEQFFKMAPVISVHAEGEAVDQALFWAKKYGTRLYLCHISQEEELISIKKAKQSNPEIFAEACPHHVLFNSSHADEFLCMKPPLRGKRDQEKLIEAIAEGVIDTWGTDHAPHLAEEKSQATTYGVPGLEFALEILLTLSKDLSLGIKKAEELYSHHPAGIFSLKGKGMLGFDYDADFTIIEEQPYEISKSDVISKAGWSPYIGKTMQYKVYATYIGGECSYQDGLFYPNHYAKELIYER